MATLTVLLAGCAPTPAPEQTPDPTPRDTSTPTPTPSVSPRTEPTTPASPSPSPAPTATSPPPTASPSATIDLAEAQRILDQLDEALTPGIQAASDEDGLADELARRMRALWTDSWRAQIQASFAREFEEADEQIADDVETRYHDVEELVLASEDCIIVRSIVAFDPWLADEAQVPAPGRYVTALVPRDDAGGLNPTEWLINYDREHSGPATPEELC